MRQYIVCFQVWNLRLDESRRLNLNFGLSFDSIFIFTYFAKAINYLALCKKIFLFLLFIIVFYIFITIYLIFNCYYIWCTIVKLSSVYKNNIQRITDRLLNGHHRGTKDGILIRSDVSTMDALFHSGVPFNLVLLKCLYYLREIESMKRFFLLYFYC